MKTKTKNKKQKQEDKSWNEHQTINKKQEKVSYNHDEVYNTHKERFEAMNCFAKYKSYTNSNAIPAFCRELAL